MPHLLGVVAFVWAVAAWLTHIIYCLKTGTYLLLIAGAFVFPVGIIHGTGVWFGWW